LFGPESGVAQQQQIVFLGPTHFSMATAWMQVSYHVYFRLFCFDAVVFCTLLNLLPSMNSLVLARGLAWGQVWMIECELGIFIAALANNGSLKCFLFSTVRNAFEKLFVSSCQSPSYSTTFGFKFYFG